MRLAFFSSGRSALPFRWVEWVHSERSEMTRPCRTRFPSRLLAKTSDSLARPVSFFWSRPIRPRLQHSSCSRWSSWILLRRYANWVWGGGWLSALGKNFGLGHGHVDFAGSSVVHMTGGVMALVGR